MSNHKWPDRFIFIFFTKQVAEFIYTTPKFTFYNDLNYTPTSYNYKIVKTTYTTQRIYPLDCTPHVQIVYSRQ